MPYTDQVEARALAQLLQDVQDTAPPPPKPPKSSRRQHRAKMVEAIQRYLAITTWARSRYTMPGGRLLVSVGGKPSKWSRIEDAAAVKYLGCIGDRLSRFNIRAAAMQRREGMPQF